jgi:hypothetical protein
MPSDQRPAGAAVGADEGLFVIAKSTRKVIDVVAVSTKSSGSPPAPPGDKPACLGRGMGYGSATKGCRSAET